jgi:hypothetical protein
MADIVDRLYSGGSYYKNQKQLTPMGHYIEEVPENLENTGGL